LLILPYRIIKYQIEGTGKKGANQKDNIKNNIIYVMIYVLAWGEAEWRPIQLPKD